MFNLINRYFPVLLLLFVCISCLFIPVSADEYDQTSYYNLLDYFSLNSNGGNRVSAEGDNTFIFTTPFYGKYGYVDILVTISGGDNNISASMSNSVDGTFRDLEIVLIGTDTYRIYGSIPYASYRNFCLKITSSVQKNRSYDFHIFEVSSNQYQHYDLDGVYTVRAANNTDSVTVSNPWSSSDLIDFDYSTINYPFTNNNFLSTVSVFFYNADKYDSIYLRFYTNAELREFDCFWHDSVVPVEIINPVISTGYDYFYSIRIDLRSVMRYRDYPLQFIFDVGASRTSVIHFEQCYGIVDSGEPSMFRHFLYQLQNMFDSVVDKLDSIFTGTDDQTDAADNFQDDIDDQSGEIDEMISVMDSVERPDITGINISSSDMVDPNTLILATSGISSALGNTIIVRVLIMALTFALVGFVLYGKR